MFSFYHCLSPTCFFFISFLFFFLSVFIAMNVILFSVRTLLFIYVIFHSTLVTFFWAFVFVYVLPSVFHITIFCLFVWFSLRFFHHQTWFVSHVRDINIFFCLHWIGLRWKKERRKMEPWIVVELTNIFLLLSHTFASYTNNTLQFRFQSDIHSHSHTHSL